MKWLPATMATMMGVSLAGWFSGCATLGEARGVSVSLVHALPVQATMLEMSAALTLRLTNESPTPLLLEGGAHRLFLNDSYVGQAVSNERLTVPALGTATQTVTVHLDTLTLVRKFAEFSQTTAPRIAYRLESKLYPADNRPFGSLRTSTGGELDLAPFLAASGVLPRTP